LLFAQAGPISFYFIIPLVAGVTGMHHHTHHFSVEMVSQELQPTP
jgi:hypothetical protein